MAIEEHLALLRKGVDCWNAWRRENPDVIPNLEEANLNRFNLSRADLRRANLVKGKFYEANLSQANLEAAKCDNADFRKANLVKANLERITLWRALLYHANLSEASLHEARLIRAGLDEAVLTKANLREAVLIRANLSAANLAGANLTEADLFGAELVWADFSEACLERTNLTMAQALYTKFSKANLTGAILEDWNTNSDTKFDGVICEYVYHKGNQQERQPSDPNRSFVQGEFSKWVQKIGNTFDLLLKNPDWEAFAYSFRRIQVENEEEELEIQSIENKGDGVVVVRVNVSPNADKGKIHSSLTQNYESMHNLLVAQYEARIQDKDKEINRLVYQFNQENERLGKVHKFMAENPKIQQTFHITAPITGFAGNVEGDQYNYALEQRQNLAEAAAEIQQLLYQLAKANPASTEVVAEAIHQEIKRNPTLKARLVSALKAGGLEALKAIFNHPLFSIPVETVKGWLEAE